MRDRDALEEVAASYGEMLLRTAYVQLGDRHAAEDVAQEALIAAWDAARRTGRDTNLKRWLLGILFNLCRKYRRSFWRRLRRERRAAEQRFLAADATAERDERLVRLQSGLQKLDEMHRAVIVLRFEQQLSVAETAEVLGIPEGTVKSRTHAAVRALRTHMGESS